MTKQPECIELFDIIKTWMEINYPQLYVRTILEGLQIRIFKLLPEEKPSDIGYYTGDILAIYPTAVYTIAPVNTRRDNFWTYTAVNLYDTNYFDILNKEVIKGLKNL